MRTTIIYYKCSCGCRVGTPQEYGYSIPKDSIVGQICGTPNNLFESFYCNHCKKETLHVYCGYRIVER